jgi:hypothetical protein
MNFNDEIIGAAPNPSEQASTSKMEASSED